jgi:hypothetical protein
VIAWLVPYALAYELTFAEQGPVHLPTQRTLQLNLGPAWNPWARGAVAAWGDVYGADDMLTTWEWPSDACDHVDGLSTVGWSDWRSAACIGTSSPTALAVTISTYDTFTGETGEADLAFNEGLAWTTSLADAARTGAFYLPAVAHHELGHIQGLAHEDDVAAAMNTYYTLAEAYLHADDLAGLRSLYGNGRDSTDLAADGWVAPGRGGLAQPIACDRAGVTGQPISEAFSLENRGTTDVDAFDVAVFLSVDTTWDAADPILSEGSGFSLAAGAHGSTFGAPTVPADVLAGTWHLGLVVDPYDRLDEADEGNNVVLCPATVVLTCADGDGDGEGDVRCGGSDCDDADPAIFAAAPETCDGRDEDCDGLVDDGATTAFYLDEDGDGVGEGAPVLACAPPPDHVPATGDCDDSDAGVRPGAPEVCDGRDQGCDGGVDEGVTAAFYLDEDRDGIGDGPPVYACEAPAEHAPVDGDCDDADPDTRPGAPEPGCDRIDRDCDGRLAPCADDEPRPGACATGDARPLGIIAALALRRRRRITQPRAPQDPRR